MSKVWRGLLLLTLAACGRVGFDYLPADGPATGTPGGADGDGDHASVDGGGANVDAGGAFSDGDASASDAGPHAGGDGGGAATDGGGSPDGGPAGSSGVRMATLPYTADMDVWNRIIAGAPSVAIAVLNPSSGVGTSLNQTFLQYVVAAHAVGISVLGYVDTNYAQRSAAAAEAEVDQYLSWYGVDGIYFDQTSSDCADQPYYQSLHDYVKQASGSKTLSVALDPGTNVPECYASVADTLVIFQNTYAQYQTFQPDTWTQNYPSSLFWHLVYDAPAASDMESAVARAQTLHAGYVWVTSDTLPNPWDTLPSDVYFLDEVGLTKP